MRVGKYNIEAHKQKTTEVRSAGNRKTEKQPRRNYIESGATPTTGIWGAIFALLVLGVKEGIRAFSKHETVEVLKLVAHHILSLLR